MIKVMEDKVRSKSLEDGKEPEFYDKIVDNNPIIEDNVISNFAQEISQIPTPSFDLSNTHTFKTKNSEVQTIKQAIKKLNEGLAEFKELFKDYLYDSYVLEEYDIQISNNSICVYADTFYVETINKINKLSEQWCITSATGDGYNLMLRIDMEDIL